MEFFSLLIQPDFSLAVHIHRSLCCQRLREIAYSWRSVFFDISAGMVLAFDPGVHTNGYGVRNIL